MKIRLSKAFNHNGKDYKELNLDLERLTGQDLIDAEENLRRSGVNTPIGAADFSRSYVAAVAAKAVNLPREALLGLSAQDFTNILNQTLIFLSGADLESVTPKTE